MELFIANNEIKYKFFMSSLNLSQKSPENVIVPLAPMKIPIIPTFLDY